MHATTLLTALLASTSLATSLPAVTYAEKRGINTSGPIPADATPIPNGYTFTAGSDASAWVRAQIALGATSSSIGIGMFEAPGCADGRGAWFDDVQYDIKYADIVPFDYAAVGTAGRAMLRGESLMMMGRGKGLDGKDTNCAVTVGFASPSSPVGCFNMSGVNCFRLQRDGR